MSKEITAEDLISLVKSFLANNFAGTVIIELHSPVGFDKVEYMKLVGGGKLVEENEDTEFVYKKYSFSDNVNLEVDYHFQEGIYWVVRIVLERSQDN